MPVAITVLLVKLASVNIGIQIVNHRFSAQCIRLPRVLVHQTNRRTVDAIICSLNAIGNALVFIDRNRKHQFVTGASIPVAQPVDVL